MDDIFKQALRPFAPKDSSVHLTTENGSAVIGHPAAGDASTAQLWARIRKVEHDNEDAAKRITRLEADLEECREFIENYSDVVDGSYGEPAPNRAMQLLNMIDETLYGAGATR